MSTNLDANQVIKKVYEEDSKSLKTESTDVINDSAVYGTLIIGTTPTEVKVSSEKLTDRKIVTLDNTSDVIIYWGLDNSVSTSHFAGRIFKDQQGAWAIGSNLSIFAIAATNGNITHISEGS